MSHAEDKRENTEEIYQLINLRWSEPAANFIISDDVRSFSFTVYHKHCEGFFPIDFQTLGTECRASRLVQIVIHPHRGSLDQRTKCQNGKFFY